MPLDVTLKINEEVDVLISQDLTNYEIYFYGEQGYITLKQLLIILRNINEEYFDEVAIEIKEVENERH